MSAQNKSPALSISIGNLWRGAVTSMALFMLIAMPIAYGVEFANASIPPVIKPIFAMVAAGIAAFLVWSDSVSWIGE